MLKSLEVSDPASCLNRAEENEPVFVLLARDVAAPATIMYWVHERLRLGKNHREDDQIIEAINCATAMLKAQRERGV